MAGTAAAQWLVGHGYRVTIIEQNDRLGGRVRSELVQGAAVEMGAGFMTSAYTNLRAFMATQGLGGRLYAQASKVGIFHNDKVRMATARSLMLGEPVPRAALLRALPLLAKTLAGWPQLDMHNFWKAARYDTRSVAAMYPHGNGKKFLELVLQPILNGYFYWNPEHTSEAMLRIVVKAALGHRTYKMQGGLQRIPEAAAKGSTVLLNHAVQEVRQGNNGLYHIKALHGGQLREFTAAGVVCATTASKVKEIFPQLSATQQAFFAAVQYSSSALVARTYKAAETRGNMSIAFPRQAGTPLSSITVADEPSGASKATHATLKIYGSGLAGPALVRQPDKKLAQTLAAAMQPVAKTVLVGSPTPLATHILRWPEALPLFDVGHFARLAAFQKGQVEDAAQAIAFAGDYLGGPFMEGAFTSGQAAAQRLHHRLHNL